ncbi:MAG TPA: bifunctional UDP-N-acetylglucosamine diphosphorylase/glucosamine-1-phosphate N-acetyltransferase GlmU [Solirubrobacteraceae bacterium]|nr:bifunctional UDP-N-acetylglucosamine diphosphorylase/glucosamine-1-phosphate N-acetyltransferase GlmU [Solirubrobacteraceae bacterium]
MTPAPTVLILAAGRGTRMRSRTPKVLHELCGLPMVLWPVRAALAAGAGQVVVVDSPERVLEGVLPEGVRLAVQPHSNGTGGAVVAGMAELDLRDGDGEVPVVVLSGDVPLVSAETIAELVRAHLMSGAGATMASTILEDPSGYGRVVRDANGAVEGVVETKADGDATPEQLRIREVNTGVYVFSGGPLREALLRLSPDNAQGELYLPQALDLIRADGATVAAHAVADERLVLGVNDRAALAQVRALAQEAIHARHMAAGVTIVDPRATVIDVDVQIGPDTTIEPFTTIRGATRIGEGCVVRHSYLIDSVLEDGASVGPFAYLRPGSVLRAGAKAGTFVEIKNSDIGAGAKVPHLSYIGDADVGEGSNLGASTITANYDGRAKHRTTIGRGVRSSVHVSFVAPVTVGDDAYTGAGSVIDEDVPPGALGIARARQTNKEGYAARRREQS